MKFLVDMNLSPRSVNFLCDAGFPSVHWSKVGRGDAPDIELMQWAAGREHIVLTAHLGLRRYSGCDATPPTEHYPDSRGYSHARRDGRCRSVCGPANTAGTRRGGDRIGRRSTRRTPCAVVQNAVAHTSSCCAHTVGSLRVSKSPPDGSQFVLGNSGTHGWSQALYKTPPYNTLTDFTLLGLVVESPRVLITPKNFPPTRCASSSLT